MTHPRNNHRPRRTSPGTTQESHLIFSEVLSSDIELVESVVTRAIKVLIKHGCVDGQCAAAELALREALANAILHGNKSHPQKRVQLECRHMKDESILLVVRDEGSGFDPAQIQDPTQPENVYRAGGRGIYLIRHFMDEVAFEQGGCEIRMKKKK